MARTKSIYIYIYIAREEKMNFTINLITNLVQCSKANDLDPEPISPENGLFYVLVDTLFSKWQEILHKKNLHKKFPSKLQQWVTAENSRPKFEANLKAESRNAPCLMQPASEIIERD